MTIFKSSFVLSAFVLLIPLRPHAQSLRKTPEPAVERIEVKGSHIRRIDLEGAWPVRVIDRTEIAGYTSVSEVLKWQVEASYGVDEAHGQGANSDIASVDVRGLGARRALVLLNGRRLATDAIAATVDLNTIPLSIVQRIEIYKAGASAQSGAGIDRTSVDWTSGDGGGGIVNIVTRRGLDQMSVSVVRTLPQLAGGTHTEVTAAAGRTTNRSSAVGFLSYQFRDQVWNINRDHSQGQFTADSGDPAIYRAVPIGGSPGTFRVTPQCQSTYTDANGGTRCLYNLSQNSTLLPELSRFSGLFTGYTDLTASTSVFGSLMITQKIAQWQRPPGTRSYTIQATRAQQLDNGQPLPGVFPGDEVEFRYRFSELGNRAERAVTDSADLTAGIQGVFTGSWDWQLSVGLSNLNKRLSGTNGYGLTSVINNVVNETNSNLPQFNFYQSFGQRGDLSSAAYEPFQVLSSSVSQVGFKLKGELMELANGPLNSTFGLATTNESYRDGVDQQMAVDNVQDRQGLDSSGQRSILALYGDVTAPLSSQIELSGSLRLESYDDFGAQMSPRAAAKWRLSDRWLFRGSLGTAFRAPSLQELNSKSYEWTEGFVDHAKCSTEITAGRSQSLSCVPKPYTAVTLGNRDLSGERATTWSAGAIWQPSSRFHMGLDVWQTTLSDWIGVDYGELTRAEALGVTTNGVVLTRDANGELQSVKAPLQNLGSREIMGLDVSGGLSTKILGYRVDFREDMGLLLLDRNEGFPGAGSRNRLGENGRPSLRNRLTATLRGSDTRSYSLTMHMIGPHDKVLADKGRLDSYSLFDFHCQLRFQKSVLSAGIRNLLGTAPPRDNSNPLADSISRTLYDELGRVLYIKYEMAL